MSSQNTFSSGAAGTILRRPSMSGLECGNPRLKLARLKSPSTFKLRIIFQAPSKVKQKLNSDCWSQKEEAPLYQALSWVLLRSRKLYMNSRLGAKGQQKQSILRHNEQQLGSTSFLLGTFLAFSFYSCVGFSPFIILSLLKRMSEFLPFQSVQKAYPSFMLSFQQPSYLDPFAQQNTPKPSLTPFFQLPSYLFLRYFPSPLDSSQMWIPHPSCWLSFQLPTYFSLMSDQFMVPIPDFTSSFHSPSKKLPEGQQYIFPYPSFMSFLKLPSKMLPLLKMILPLPCFLPSSHSPSQVASSMVYLPLPCRKPSLTSPSQELPSGHLQVPLPVILLSVNSPSQTIPLAQMNLPLPLSSPLQNSPSYLLPFLKTTLPGPLRHLPQISLSCELVEISPSNFSQSILVSSMGSIILLFMMLSYTIEVQCVRMQHHWKRCGAILPSWLWLQACTTLASITVGAWISSTGSCVMLILLFTMKSGLGVRKTSSLSEMPSRYCLSRDLSIWLSLLSVSFCLAMASRSSSTLLCRLKKLFRYLNSSYSSAVSSWNWFFISSDISDSSTVFSQKGSTFSFSVSNLLHSSAVLRILSPSSRFSLSFSTAFLELLVSSLSLRSSSSLNLFIFSLSSWQFLEMLSFSFLSALFLAPLSFLCCRILSLSRSILERLSAIFLASSSILRVMFLLSSKFLLCSSVFLPVSEEYFWCICSSSVQCLVCLASRLNFMC